MEEVYSYAVLQSDTTQVEEEQVYETHCEDDGNYGPIYTEPPKAVEEIFEGKRFHRLYHQNIRYLYLIMYIEL